MLLGLSTILHVVVYWLISVPQLLHGYFNKHKYFHSKLIAAKDSTDIYKNLFWVAPYSQVVITTLYVWFGSFIPDALLDVTPKSGFSYSNELGSTAGTAVSLESNFSAWVVQKLPKNTITVKIHMYFLLHKKWFS